jgi:predicted RNA binding protein YcfA (HicA-like mRNA interferase family)
MKWDELHSLIRKRGWIVFRISGSHVIYKKGARIYPVPYHKGKEAGKGLALKIKKDLEL